MCSCCHLHTQFSCEKGGGVYGRISIINNNLSIILRINRCNYHKYCLNNSFGYNFGQIIKRHICLAERCVVYPYFYVVTAFLRLSFPILIILNFLSFVKFFINVFNQIYNWLFIFNIRCLSVSIEFSKPLICLW